MGDRKKWTRKWTRNLKEKTDIKAKGTAGKSSSFMTY